MNILFTRRTIGRVQGDSVNASRLRRYFGISLLASGAVFMAAAEGPVHQPRRAVEPRPVTNPQPGSAAAKLRGRPEPILITNKPSRAGNLGKSGVDRQRVREDRAQYLQRLTKERASGSARTRGMAIYQPKDGGTPLLTNRIEKYDGRSDYKRIKINFDPIVIPNRWGATFGKYSDTDIHKYVDHYAKLYSIDPSLIHAVIQVESRGNPYAVSPKGAAGLMQLMPGTAAGLKVTNVFDPAENIGGGVQYLSKMLAMFKGDTDLALAGYNAGPLTVQQYGGIPPYRETQNYVYYVNLYWNHFKANGNSFPYKPFDPSLTITAIRAKREERMKTRALGDTAKTVHEIQFASGAVESADGVWHQGDFLYLTKDGRTHRLREDFVVAVDGVALGPDGPVTPSELVAVPDATVPLPKDEPVQLAAQI